MTMLCPEPEVLTPSAFSGFFFGQSTNASMAAIERMVSDVARTDIPVFITGESGTGKGVLASAIHHLSARRHQEFVRITCAGLSPRSGIVWRESGRFLGLTSDQTRGTILLDEIVELDPSVQAYLVDEFPEAESRDGESQPRIVSVTRREIDPSIRSGHFLGVLYYRLKGVALRVPSLRERKEDIPSLVEFLIAKHASNFNLPAHLSDRAMHFLADYDWPGNVRELEKAIIAILVVGNENVVLDSLRSGRNPAIAGRNGSNKQKLSLKEVSRSASQRAERDLIRKVLERTQWNRKQAARELQISYKALLYKLKQIEQNGDASH